MNINQAKEQLLNEVIPVLNEQLAISLQHTINCQGISLSDQIQTTIDSIHALCSPQEEQKNFVKEVEQLEQNCTTPRISYQSMGGCDHWPAELHNHLISFICEAIQNAQKHARATSINILLISRPEDITLTLSDDGIGIAEESSGFGLETTRAWAKMNSGTLSITTLPESGTTICLKLPLKDSVSSLLETNLQKKFTRTLHDEICQSLTGLTLLSATLRDATPEDDTATWQRLRTSTNAFKATTATCRDLAHSLSMDINS